MWGSRVQTNKHIFDLLIGLGFSGVSWCPVASEDDLDKYVGANLLEVNFSGVQPTGDVVKFLEDKEDVIRGVVLVNFLTTRGYFQLGIYFDGIDDYSGSRIVFKRDRDILSSLVL